MQKFALLLLHKIQQKQYTKCILGLQLSENALSNVHQKHHVSSEILYLRYNNEIMFNILKYFPNIYWCVGFFFRFVALITCCFPYFHEMYMIGLLS